MGKPIYRLKTNGILKDRIDGERVYFDRKHRPYIKENYHASELRNYNLPEDAEIYISIKGAGQ